MRNLMLLVLSALLALGLAAQPCSNADVRGIYLFQTTGFQMMRDLSPALPELMAPARGAGFLYYDGNGKASGQVIFTIGGIPVNFEFVDLAYSINPDCTGTASYRLKMLPEGVLMGPDQHKLSVLQDGALVKTLMVDAGGRTAIMVTDLRRVSRGPRSCYQSMIRGSYAMHYDGWVNMQVFNPNQPMYYAPAVGLGAFRVDPERGNTGGGTHNWGGIAGETELVSGNWQVNPDCTGTFEYQARQKATGQVMAGKAPIFVLGDGAEIMALVLETPAFQWFVRTALP